MKYLFIIGGLFVFIEAVGSIWYPLNDKSLIAQGLRGVRAAVGLSIFIVGAISEIH